MKLLTTLFSLLFACSLNGQCDSLAPHFWEESWLSCTTKNNPIVPGLYSHYQLFDLGQVYQIDSFHFYNYNLSDLSHGIKSFSLYASIDSMNWSDQGFFTADIATGSSDYAGQSFELSSIFSARYLLINAIDNYGGSCVGYSEVVFGIDTVLCQDFNPSISIEYLLCDDIFHIQVDNLESEKNYLFDWSPTGSGSSVSFKDEGFYQLVITDDRCTESFQFELEKPQDAATGWMAGAEIPAGQYISSIDLSTSGNINPANNVILNAQSIELESEFNVRAFGQFEAHIIDCEQHPSEYFITDHVAPLRSKYVYDDYIGAGHQFGIYTDDNNQASISGFGEIGLNNSYRFLAQSTFGADEGMAIQANQMGYEEWLDWQMSIPHSSYFNYLTFVMRFNQSAILYWLSWHRTWWNNILTGEEYLRDRIAYALSQIFVISSKSLLQNFGDGLTSYYDMLAGHAFGNYRDLLYDVTLHPTMGHYLSHMSNPKTVAEINQFPDENYAREILQLFSIGLYELNIDGTRKKDGQGNDIPTYDNNDIIEFAKIFTGLTGDGRIFGTPVSAIANKDGDSYMTRPMVMHEDQHEPGPKHLLNGYVVPGGQTGLKDINDAIDNIFSHPNIGPFIGKKLIQHLVKSHPSPAYIQRVAEKFNDNGLGVRGDLSAVIKAILLDPEARDCEWIDDQDQGKLKEPLLRFTQLYKAFDIKSTSSTFFALGEQIEASTGQAPLRAPSVFNFFQSDHTPPGILSDLTIEAPEFQIMNAATSIGYVNLMNTATILDNPLPLEEGIALLQFETELTLVNDHQKLIDHLNTKLTNGTLKASTLTTLHAALNQMNSFTDLEKIKMAIYLITSSPEFNILK